MSIPHSCGWFVKCTVVLGLSACSTPESAPPEADEAVVTATPAPSPEVLAMGAAAWQQGMCVKCHRDGGVGGDRAPDLTDDAWIHCDGTIDGIRGVLVTGVPEDQLSDPSRPFSMNPVTNLVPDPAQLDALAAYVWTLSNGTGDGTS